VDYDDRMSITGRQELVELGRIYLLFNNPQVPNSDSNRNLGSGQQTTRAGWQRQGGQAEQSNRQVRKQTNTTFETKRKQNKNDKRASRCNGTTESFKVNVSSLQLLAPLSIATRDSSHHLVPSQLHFLLLREIVTGDDSDDDAVTPQSTKEEGDNQTK
jgi:hypothetical protein